MSLSLQSTFANHLFVAISGSDIIYGGLGAAQETQASFDELWKQVLSGPTYKFVSKTAGTMAAIFVIAWVFRHKRELEGGAEQLKQIFVSYLFGPILVFILLVVQIGDQTTLGYTMLGIRNFNNTFTNMILSQMAFQVTDPVVKGLAKIQAEQLTSSGFQDCLKNVNETERNQCFTQLDDKFSKILAPYRDETWAQNLNDRFEAEVKSYTQNFVEQWLTNGIEQLGGLADQVLISGVIVICNSVSTAVAWVVEIIGLMIAFMGPMIMAFCLFPKFEEAWKPWLVGMVGVGGVSMTYKFSIGLVSMQVLNSTGPTQMIAPICLALFGLALAGSLILGGGVAAFQAGQSALSSGGSSAGRAGFGAIRGTARAIGGKR